MEILVPAVLYPFRHVAQRVVQPKAVRHAVSHRRCPHMSGHHMGQVPNRGPRKVESVCLGPHHRRSRTGIVLNYSPPNTLPYSFLHVLHTPIPTRLVAGISSS